MERSLHRRLFDAAALTALALMVAVVFGQTRTFAFLLYDDPGIIYRHPQVCAGLTGSGIVWAFTHAHPYIWMPLTSLTHMLDVSLFGLWAGGHHLSSVFFHTINSMLLYLLLRRLTGRAGLSFVVAALFAVHPLRAESVVWLSSRKDLTSGLFFMLTLLTYHWYAARPNWRRYMMVVVCFALGLMCKPTLIPLPGLLLLLDWWPLERLQWRNAARRVAEKVPLILVAGLRTVLEFKTQEVSLDSASFAQAPLSARPAETASNFVGYIWHWLYPVPLSIHYPRPLEAPPLWPGAIALVALLGITCALLLAHRRRALAVGWFWYLGMMLPMSGVIQYGHAVMADRYTYLPHIGLAILAVWLFEMLLAPDNGAARLWTARITAAVCLVIVTILGWWQVGHWRDTETVFRRALAATSDNDVAHKMVGNALLNRGANEEALDHFRAAVKISPRNTSNHYQLGRALVLTGRHEEAAPHLAAVANAEPGHGWSRAMLGNALLHMREYDEALATLTDAARRLPDEAQVQEWYGVALLKLGKNEQGHAALRRALELRGDSAAARDELAVCLREWNLVDAADVYAPNLLTNP